MSAQHHTTPNEERALRGIRAIKLHPDFGLMHGSRRSDRIAAASDVIADILHAMSRTAAMSNLELEELLQRALRTYYGDAEDREEREVQRCTIVCDVELVNGEDPLEYLGGVLEVGDADSRIAGISLYNEDLTSEG